MRNCRKSDEKEFVDDDGKTHPLDTWKCGDCDHEGIERNVKKHWNNTHAETPVDKKKFSCPNCKKEFGRKFVMDKHINKVHKGIGPKCSKCDKTFSLDQHVKAHERICPK